MPIAARILGIAILPVMLALGGGFWLLTLTLTESVKSGARETIAEVQRSHSRLWAESDAVQQAAAATVAENPSLKAGVVLLRQAAGRSEDARATVADQLLEVHQGLAYDLVAILDAEQRPVASTIRNPNGEITHVETPGSGPGAMRPQGILEINRRVFRTAMIPINLGEENIGFLVTGRQFDLRAPYGFAMLLRGGELAAGGITDPAQSTRNAEIRAALTRCAPQTPSCDLHAAGETWVASHLQLAGISESGYSLWILQSVDATLTKLTSGLNQVFVLLVTGLLVIAAGLALVTSRGVAKPLEQLVKRLKESESTGVLRGDLELNSSTREVNDLARAFNDAAKAVADSQRRLDEAYLQFTRTMAQALDARDHYTAGHSNRVSVYATRVAQALALPPQEQKNVEVGATLHDIGKIGVPDCVLQKPGRLNDDEFRQIKEHTVLGKRILQGVVNFRDYLSIVELHHENHDGTGYPWGLRGENIPLGARIVHVVDAFDAMTTSRPYRKAMPTAKALEVLQENAGTQFDPAIVEVFLQLVRSDPGLLPPDPESIVNLHGAVTAEVAANTPTKSS